MLNWQFEAPTFANISADLRAYNALLFRVSTNLVHASSKDSFKEIIPVDLQINRTLELLANLEADLYRRIQFFDTETESATLLIRPLSCIMKLPPLMLSLVEKEPKRRSSYTPREKVRGPYRSYTVQEKNHVVQLNKDGMSFAAISKNLEIPQKNVVRWCKEGYHTADSNRRIADTQMEVDLVAWINSAKQNGIVRQAEIQRKARELCRNNLFKASRGWLKNFLKRYSSQIRQEVINHMVKQEERLIDQTQSINESSIYE